MKKDVLLWFHVLVSAEQCGIRSVKWWWSNKFHFFCEWNKSKQIYHNRNCCIFDVIYVPHIDERLNDAGFWNRKFEVDC